MRKIETGKSGWIKDARVDFVREGAMKGILAVQIEMSGDASRGSFDDVAAFVTTLAATRLPARRIVRFTGGMTDHDPNLTLLIKSLYDYGYELQCVTDDRMVYSWMQWMSWNIVRSKDTVVMTACDELWFTPETLPKGDVSYPPRPNRFTFLYVGGKHSFDDVDEFMCSSKHVWNLL